MKLGLVLALAGCYSKPEYSGPRDGAVDAGDADDANDAPPDAISDVPTVTFADDGAGAIVTGPWFAIHFASANTGFHFPDSIRIDDVEYLVDDPNAPCAIENQVGLAFFPAARVAPR